MLALLHRIVRKCAGFWMPAMTKLRHAEPTGVQKPVAVTAISGEALLSQNCSDSEAAISVLFSGETKPRAYVNEVHIKALVSSPVFRRATIALQIFEVYPPALLARRISCKLMLRARRPLADPCNVFSELKGQSAYMFRVPRMILASGTAPGNSRKFTAKQKANG
ncbi:hypothetical protein [Bradyrhizobium sp.]|uniref:hypothetical protein n=1 Tax=Bradyrhizobium sp. TaxID=376 RepID=UPI001EB0EFA6|nr:hypothetical protein [Bradyrhizobium sp.]MBV8919697.1 hypothetical protein [Bradyrhizobium sp.]MBV9985437.1 hypothetical protein [Bradyrhizobium sp.]